MVHPDLAGVSIIGQSGPAALGVLALGLLNGQSAGQAHAANCLIQAAGELGFGVRAPAFLPESLNSVLFETQWLYWILAIGAAAALFLAGQNRANRRFVMAGAAIVLLTLVWMAAAWLVVTPKERLYHVHQELADAVKAGNVDRIVSFLAPDFQCTALSIHILPEAKPELADRLKRYNVKGTTIWHYHSDISGRAAYTQVTLVTQTDLGSITTRWGLSWDDMNPDAQGDWKIKLADFQGMGADSRRGGQLIP
jgi:hypothetical protein